MDESYEGKFTMTNVDKGFKDLCFNHVDATAYALVSLKEDYIKSRLRYPFNIMPFARLATPFIVLRESKPEVSDRKVNIRVKLEINQRYPKWLSKIFLKGD